VFGQDSPVDEIAAALTRRKFPFLFVTDENLPKTLGNVAVPSKSFSQTHLLEASAQLVEAIPCRSLNR
jgi:hypothetical protein